MADIKIISNREVAPIDPLKDISNGVSQPTEKLGSVGQSLSAYHVGDIVGILGLLLTFFTFVQARGAKNAAIKAAETAIKNRDYVEIATRLTELSAKLRLIRDVYRTDDWSTIEITKDHAVAIAVEIKAIEIGNEEIVILMNSIEVVLREIDPSLDDIKSDSKKRLAKVSYSQRVNKLADKVDLIKISKVKNGK